MTFSPEVVEGIRAAAEADPRREVCGFVVRWPCGASEILPIPNVAEKESAVDTFEMDPIEQLRALKRIDRGGGRILAIYHSHPERPAVLSRRDRDGALDGETSRWPGAELLIVSVRQGRAVESCRYRLVNGEFEQLRLDD